jgi:hypothetical protein
MASGLGQPASGCKAPERWLNGRAEMGVALPTSERAKRRWVQASGRLNTNLEGVVPICEVCLGPELVGNGRGTNTNLEEASPVCEAWLGPGLVHV